jgi:nitrous oxidase accessory protein NosD
MISVSRQSVLEYCVFEHAFTGVQVHYSTTTIRDCVFRGNFEGLRFSTADVLVEHNDFLDNDYAVRCETNGSRAVIRRNRIAGNRYGFFPVARSDATTRITENDVTGSAEYQVYLGQAQRADLDYANNWWGSADPEVIAAGVFDKSRDPLLGRVAWEPFLTVPVGDAGVR